MHDQACCMFNVSWRWNSTFKIDQDSVSPYVDGPDSNGRCFPFPTYFDTRRGQKWHLKALKVTVKRILKYSDIQSTWKHPGSIGFSEVVETTATHEIVAALTFGKGGGRHPCVVALEI